MSQEPVSGLRVGIVGNRRILVVGIEQRQAKRFRKIDGKKAHREEIFRRVLVADLGRRTGFALLGDGRKTVVGSDNDVGRCGEPEIVKRLAQLGQIVIGIFDAGERRWAVDARDHGVEAVAGVMLAAVGIARPEHQHEGLAAFLEHRQHDFARNIGEIGLLRGVGHQGAGRPGVAGLAVLATRGRRLREIRLCQRTLHLLRERDAILAAGSVVDHDRMQATRAWLVGVIENQGRPELSDRGGAVAVSPRHFQHGLLVEIVAAEMLVGVDDDRVDLQERRHGAIRGPDRITRIYRVREVAGVAEIVTGRHCGSIGGGEGRKQRVRIPEIDALVADLSHGRRGLRCDDLPTQSVGHEQDQVARRVVLGCRYADREQDQSKRRQ